MDSNRFNQILVVDSIPAGELNTARRLFDDVETYAGAYAPSPAVAYLRVESASEFTQCISDCRERAINFDVIPMLHIECHGDEDGLQFADGSRADWDELKLPLTELNIATRLNLLIAVAACTGGALAKVIRMSDRAPFWGLIGPTRTLFPQDLETAFRALYLTLLSTRSPAKSVEAMDAATTPGWFWRTTAQGLFEKVWTNYKKDYCTSEVLEMRARRMLDRLRLMSPGESPSLDHLRRLLVEREPIAFERYRRTFFMCDIVPDHVERFRVEYVA